MVKRYNYTYKITNKVNGRIYIGVHRTDNLNDGYMGSGINIRRAIAKHGVDNFTKEILQFFTTYADALAHEKELVTPEFINEDSNYNLREGGFGSCALSNISRAKISTNMKARWSEPESRSILLAAFREPERKAACSIGIKKWIRNNPDLHQERMTKINKNSDKITKTANKHRGMKRSVEACKNIRDAIHQTILKDPSLRQKRSGRGGTYMFNPTTKEIKRIARDQEPPIGWTLGSGPKRDASNYAGKNLGSFFAYNATTNVMKRIQEDQELPGGFVKGKRPNPPGFKKNKRK